MIISATVPSGLKLYLGDGVAPDEGGSDWVIRTFDAALTEWTWYYLAITYDGQSATAYVDGKPIGTQAVNITLSKTRTESWIGGVPAYTAPARGIIGPMRISSTVHPAEAIQRTYETALRCEPK
jgi:hypothetical protein